MQLNAQEIATLRRGERLEVDVPEVGGRCLLMREADLTGLLAQSMSDLPMTAVSLLVDSAMQDNDADDPLLASYQSCRP